MTVTLDIFNQAELWCPKLILEDLSLAFGGFLSLSVWRPTLETLSPSSHSRKLSPPFQALKICSQQADRLVTPHGECWTGGNEITGALGFAHFWQLIFGASNVMLVWHGYTDDQLSKICQTEGSRNYQLRKVNMRGSHWLVQPPLPSSVVEGYLKEARDSKYEEMYQMSEFHANPVSQDVLAAIKEDKHVLGWIV